MKWYYDATNKDGLKYPFDDRWATNPYQTILLLLSYLVQYKKVYIRYKNGIDILLNEK